MSLKRFTITEELKDATSEEVPIVDMEPIEDPFDNSDTKEVVVQDLIDDVPRVEEAHCEDYQIEDDPIMEKQLIKPPVMEDQPSKDPSPDTGSQDLAQFLQLV